MAEKYYRVIFVYPDGHIEDIDDTFKTGSEALEYGNQIMGQISSTEQYRSKYSEDKKDPYFMIVEIKDKKRSLVYDNRK